MKHLFIGGPADGKWIEINPKFADLPQRIRDEIPYRYVEEPLTATVTVNVFNYLPWIHRIPKRRTWNRGEISWSDWETHIMFRGEWISEEAAFITLLEGYNKYVGSCRRCGFNEAPRRRRAGTGYEG